MSGDFSDTLRLLRCLVLLGSNLRSSKGAGSTCRVSLRPSLEAASLGVHRHSTLDLIRTHCCSGARFIEIPCGGIQGRRQCDLQTTLRPHEERLVLGEPQRELACGLITSLDQALVYTPASPVRQKPRGSDSGTVASFRTCKVSNSRETCRTTRVRGGPHKDRLGWPRSSYLLPPPTPRPARPHTPFLSPFAAPPSAQPLNPPAISNAPPFSNHVVSRVAAIDGQIRSSSRLFSHRILRFVRNRGCRHLTFTGEQTIDCESSGTPIALLS